MPPPKEAVYRRRRRRAVRHQSVQAHLETCLARKWDGDDGRAVPPWVDDRFGEAPFVRRSGSAINPHAHSRCCLIDGVLDAERDKLRFHEAPTIGETEVAALPEAVLTTII